MSRKELLTLDFEGVLKYFRVQLPKKYRSEEAAREMIMMAVTLKVLEITFSYFAELGMSFFLSKSLTDLDWNNHDN